MKFPSWSDIGIYFYPAFAVIFEDENNFGLVKYEDISITYTSVRFVENQPVPDDTKIIEYTWRYVKKNGTRDLRYSENYQIPIVEYGEIIINANKRYVKKYMFSNSVETLAFSQVYNKYKNKLLLKSEPNNNEEQKPIKEKIGIFYEYRYYKILGVMPGASPEEIRAGYLSALKKYHPDKVDSLGDEIKLLAEKKTKEIIEAYEKIKK